MHLFKQRKEEIPFNIFKAMETWWRVFNSQDTVRAWQDVYCLPCNLETPGNLNAARMDFTIPYDKPILISVANACTSVHEKDGNIWTKKKMHDEVKHKVDILTDTSLVIDDKDMSDKAKRYRSDFFRLNQDTISITDGYWLPLPAGYLSRGKHKIRRASCNNLGTQASTDYEITIV